MISRAGKQAIYGLVFLLVIVGISLGIYFLFLKPQPSCSDNKQNQGEENIDCGGPCKSCASASLSILVKGKSYFDLARLNKTTFYIDFENPNADFWVRKFDYTLNVYNTIGAKIASFSGTSSIAPTGERIIVIPAADIDARDIARTDLGVMNPDWAPLVEYHVDGVSVSSVGAKVVTGGKIYVSGAVTNNVASIAKKIYIGAVFKDRSGNIVNASSTTIDSVQPFSKNNFEIFLTPNQTSQIDLAKTEVFTEVIR